VRSMAQCMGMGQAAGIAASLAVENQCRPIDINVETLQQKLRGYGAILEG
jgi:hypothetical protein